MASSEQLEALMHGHAKVRKGRCDAGPSMTILQEFHCAVLGVRNEDLDQGLVGKILMKSCQRSLHDLVQVLVRRSCGDPAAILLKKMLCIGACLKVLLGCP